MLRDRPRIKCLRGLMTSGPHRLSVLTLGPPRLVHSGRCQAAVLHHLAQPGTRASVSGVAGGIRTGRYTSAQALPTDNRTAPGIGVRLTDAPSSTEAPPPT